MRTGLAVAVVLLYRLQAVVEAEVEAEAVGVL